MYCNLASASSRWWTPPPPMMSVPSSPSSSPTTSPNAMMHIHLTADHSITKWTPYMSGGTIGQWCVRLVEIKYMHDIVSVIKTYTLLKSICTSLQPHPQHSSVTATRWAPSHSEATTLHLKVKWSHTFYNTWNATYFVSLQASRQQGPDAGSSTRAPPSHSVQSHTLNWGRAWGHEAWGQLLQPIPFDMPGNGGWL